MMRSIAVASGKGGVGKTLLSSNFGCFLAIEGHKVLVFDADLGLANLDIALGLNPTKSLKHVIRSGVSLKDIIIEGPAGMHVVPGGSGVSELANLNPQRLESLLSEIQDVAHDYDYVIFDVAAGIDTLAVSFMAAADELALVCTPEPSAMIDAYAAVKMLNSVRPTAEISVVVNMCDSLRHGKLVYERLQMITGQFLQRDIKFAGSIRRDDNMIACTRQRQPIVLAHPTSNGAKDIEETVKSLFYGKEPGVKEPGLAQRLLNILLMRKSA